MFCTHYRLVEKLSIGHQSCLYVPQLVCISQHGCTCSGCLRQCFLQDIIQTTCQCMYLWMLSGKQGYLLKKKLWKYCMSDDDESATAFVMQWWWPIKYKTLFSVICYTVNSANKYMYNWPSLAPRQLRNTVGHFVWSRFWSLNRAGDPPLWPKPKHVGQTLRSLNALLHDTD